MSNNNVADQVAESVREYREKHSTAAQAQVVGKCGVFSPWRNEVGVLDIDWEAMKALPDKRPQESGEEVGKRFLAERNTHGGKARSASKTHDSLSEYCDLATDSGHSSANGLNG